MRSTSALVCTSKVAIDGYALDAKSNSKLARLIMDCDITCWRNDGNN